MIPLDNIKNGNQFVVTAAGAENIIHQLPNFTPVIQENATYPNDDHTFYPNGILPDGSPLPVAVAVGLKLQAGMVITVDQLVYHCAKTAYDQKAYQCVRGAVTRPGDTEFPATTGYFYLTYADVTRVEAYTAPIPNPVDTTVTIIAGSTTYALGQVTDGQIVELKLEVKQDVPAGQSPPQPPTARIHVVQRTLYQQSTTNAPNARVSLRNSNGDELRSGHTDVNGFVEFPGNLCIESNVLHVETPAGFSSGSSAAIREIELGLPASYHQKTVLQLPVRAVFVQGAGSGAPRSNADVLAIIRSAQPNQSFSIGNGGRLLLRFEPPLIHKTGQPILQIMESNAGNPGESYRIVFGNQVDLAAIRVQEITGVTVTPGPTQTVYDIFLPVANNVSDGTRFEWIEIDDMNGGGGVAGQPANQLGVDLSSIRGYAIEQSIAMLLDVSGSMSVDDQWVRSGDDADAKEAEREQRREVADESLYWLSFQAVLNSLLPVAPAELLTTKFRMYAFHGVDRPPHSKRIELLGGPALLAAFRTTVAMPEQMRKTYNDYTPLASAMKKGFDDLASDSAPCRTMIVITDGEGTPANEAHPSEEIAKAQEQIVHGHWVGVIELIGYKVYPRAAINKLLRFNAQGWSVAPHLVDNKNQLDTLLNLLRTKYALQ